MGTPALPEVSSLQYVNILRHTSQTNAYLFTTNVQIGFISSNLLRSSLFVSISDEGSLPEIALSDASKLALTYFSLFTRSVHVLYSEKQYMSVDHRVYQLKRWFSLDSMSVNQGIYQLNQWLTLYNTSLDQAKQA